MFFVELHSGLIVCTDFEVYLLDISLFHLLNKLLEECGADALFAMGCVYREHQDSCGRRRRSDADEKTNDDLVSESNQEPFRGCFVEVVENCRVISFR